MVQSKMFSHLDLYAAHEKPINVPGVPLASRITIFIRLVKQSHRNAAIDRFQRRVGVSLVRDAIHDDVDLLRFLIQIYLSAIEEVLAAISSEWKIQLRIDWKDGITTHQWAIDVAEISVPYGVDPVVVVLSLEALNQRSVVGEINSFINIVDKRLLWDKEVGRKITTHELDLVLSYEEHHLPVEDALI